MQVHNALRAAGASHPGLLRETNEDRFHYDPSRGLFMVIDGVGGQAAGERAADIALAELRASLEDGPGPAADRVRAAVVRANNEIFRLASVRPEWKGMACVLTVAVIDGTDVVVGHVGDTRLYKLRRGRMDKLTRDHSPVGEREDAGEITEAEAMRHPRRNEVYRDVGSQVYSVEDTGFVDVFRVPFEPDAALLLCSDGLTDLVPAGTIQSTVEESAGHAYEIVRALIDAANDAGGKDNVTIVYVEGGQFARGEDTRDLGRVRAARSPAAADERPMRGIRGWILALVVVLIATGVYGTRTRWIPRPGPVVPVAVDGILGVQPGESIAAAIERAEPGTVILVEPGEYRERLVMKNGVTVHSRVPRGAALRLPGDASEFDAAIVARDIADATVSGFRIIGDAATPLGAGVFASHAGLTLVDVEISGAQHAAVEFGAGASGGFLAGDIHDNPGSAVIVRAGATPRLVHSVFARNAVSQRSAGPLLIEPGARAEFRANVFLDIAVDGLIVPDERTRAAIARDNWFVGGLQARPAPPSGRAGRRGR